MSDSEIKKPFDIWEKLEAIIKKRESIILIFIVLLAFAYIPGKIFSYGWVPYDDALRHVAFSMIDAKWSDVVAIEENLESDHNPGWHYILKFLYKHCGFDKSDLTFFSFAGLFFIFNLCGILVSSPISWCLALVIMANIDTSFGIRVLLGRPYVFSCAVTLILLHIWNVRSEKDEEAWFRKGWVKYFISIVALVLATWIHGSWYLFLLLPASFFLAGKTKIAFIQAALVFLSTIIGAGLSGDFCGFMYFHFVATFQIFNESIPNWMLVDELACGQQYISWAVYVAILAILCNIKGKFHFKDIGKDPVFIMILLCWLCGIATARFWLDWGIVALLLWMSYRIDDLICSSVFLKSPRIKYCLTSFVIVTMVLCFANDRDGRFSKDAKYQAIDFFSEAAQENLKGWEPQPGGIVYSPHMGVFYQHFYEYPNAQWKYILGFESAIMPLEDRKIFRNIMYNYNDRMPEIFLPWINKMTEKDRIIMNHIPGYFPQMEWKRANLRYWIGRLKVASDTVELKDSKTK